MITWVLIIIIQTGYGVSTTSVVFHSPQSCQEAASKVIKLSPNNVVAYCTKDMNIN